MTRETDSSGTPAIPTHERGFRSWWMKLMIGDDLVKAQKRMRYAGIAGFVSVAILFVGALMSFGGVDAAGTPLIGGRAFTFVMAEASLTAFLAFGVLKRNRAAASLLFFGFFVVKTAAFFAGVGKPILLVHLVIFGYFFFQGMRGALTFHQLTHPRRAIAPCPGTRKPGPIRELRTP